MNETTNRWMFPAGCVSLVIGLLGFVASAGVAGGGTPEGSLVAGLLNPLFFVGVPLGLFWIVRGASHKSTR